MWERFRAYWAMSACDGKRYKRWFRYRPRDVWQQFALLTGCSATNLTTYRRERDENGGYVFPSKREDKRDGARAEALECVEPELPDYIREKIRAARKRDHLTLGKLAQMCSDYFSFRITRQRLKRRMGRMGFFYGERTGKFEDRRNTPENERQLKAYCEFVENNTEYNEETDRYFYTRGVGFGDGACDWARSFFKRSWMFAGCTTRECAKSRDEGERINMVGSIYSHTYDPNSITSWASTEADKVKYTTGSEVLDHIVKHVLPNGPTFYVLDNAKNNRRIDPAAHKLENDDLASWIEENDHHEATKFNDYWKSECDGETTKRGLRGKLMKYIRENDLTEVAIVLRSHGIIPRYLPRYFPELNPIELIWAIIKARYKKTDATRPWKERLKEAIDSVTEEEIERAIDHTIRYALKTLKQLKEASAALQAEQLEVALSDDDEYSDSEEYWAGQAEHDEGEGEGYGEP